MSFPRVGYWNIVPKEVPSAQQTTLILLSSHCCILVCDNAIYYWPSRFPTGIFGALFFFDWDDDGGGVSSLDSRSRLEYAQFSRFIDVHG